MRAAATGVLRGGPFTNGQVCLLCVCVAFFVGCTPTDVCAVRSSIDSSARSINI